MPRLLKQEASLAKGRGTGERRWRDSAPNSAAVEKSPAERAGRRNSAIDCARDRAKRRKIRLVQNFFIKIWLQSGEKGGIVKAVKRLSKGIFFDTRRG